MTALEAWENFYVIVGSSAGALIGLQFVVIALIAELPIADYANTGSAFATPTVVHFAAVLLLSVILSAPWPGITVAAGLWALVGFAGVVYAVFVAWRMKVQTGYRPEFEDWLFNAVLPFVAYAVLPASATRPDRISAMRCLALERRRCCCSSSGFITPGTLSRTTSLS